MKFSFLFLVTLLILNIHTKRTLADPYCIACEAIDSTSPILSFRWEGSGGISGDGDLVYRLNGQENRIHIRFTEVGLFDGNLFLKFFNPETGRSTGGLPNVPWDGNPKLNRAQISFKGSQAQIEGLLNCRRILQALRPR